MTNTHQSVSALALAEQQLKNRFTQAQGETRPHLTEPFYPERVDMRRELQELLNLEFSDWEPKRKSYYYKGEGLSPAAKLLKQESLTLYRKVFDWDTSYELEVSYETYPNECYHTFQLKNEAELKEYIQTRKEICGNLDEPTNAEETNGGLEYNFEIIDETSRDFHIRVNNLRLKEQEEAKQ